MDFIYYGSELAKDSSQTKPWAIALKKTWVKVGASFANIESFIHCAKAFPSPDKLLEFSKSFEGAEDMKQLLQAIDDSIHPLKEWLTAFDLMNSWLIQNRRKASMEKRIGYLSCCSKSVANFFPSPELSEVTREMLDLHGMD